MAKIGNAPRNSEMSYLRDEINESAANTYTQKAITVTPTILIHEITIWVTRPQNIDGTETDVWVELNKTTDTALKGVGDADFIYGVHTTLLCGVAQGTLSEYTVHTREVPERIVFNRPVRITGSALYWNILGASNAQALAAEILIGYTTEE